MDHISFVKTNVNNVESNNKFFFSWIDYIDIIDISISLDRLHIKQLMR